MRQLWRQPCETTSPTGTSGNLRGIRQGPQERYRQPSSVAEHPRRRADWAAPISGVTGDPNAVRSPCRSARRPLNRRRRRARRREHEHHQHGDRQGREDAYYDPTAAELLRCEHAAQNAAARDRPSSTRYRQFRDPRLVRVPTWNRSPSTCSLVKELAVLRPPARQFPGVVMQGDSLAILCDELRRASLASIGAGEHADAGDQLGGRAATARIREGGATRSPRGA